MSDLPRHVMYGAPEAIVLERSVQGAVDLAWEVLQPDTDPIIVEEWEEGVPNQVPAQCIAVWEVPTEPHSEAPPIVSMAHRTEVN